MGENNMFSSNKCFFMMQQWMNKQKDAARTKLFASWITVRRSNLITWITDVFSTLDI